MVAILSRLQCVKSLNVSLLLGEWLPFPRAQTINQQMLSQIKAVPANVIFSCSQLEIKFILFYFILSYCFEDIIAWGNGLIAGKFLPDTIKTCGWLNPQVQTSWEF